MTFFDLLKYLLLLSLFAVSGWYFLTYEKTEHIPDSDLGACNEPLSYRIGEIDTRFGISEKSAKEAMQTAASLWSDAVGQPIAYQHKEGDIVVNFVYDERQKLVAGERRFRERIESEQIRMDQLEQVYENRRKQFEKRSEEYQEKAERLQNEIDDLNRWVQEKNRSGGLTPGDQQSFDQRKRDVERLQQQVLNERSELDSMAEEVNRYADQLNNRVKENNKLIDQYNDEFTGENRFAKATYQNTEIGGVITVNQFINQRDLELVLAHELGHALGITHGNEPESIMYSQMGGQQIFPILQLSREDQKAISQKCS